MKMSPRWHSVLNGTLVLFFIVGSLGNLLAPPAIQDGYHRWGFPDWFHYLTGTLEMSTALLLAVPATRLLGTGLGCTVMLAAAGTVLLHGEIPHAAAPVAVLALLVLNGRFASAPAALAAR